MKSSQERSSSPKRSPPADLTPFWVPNRSGFRSDLAPKSALGPSVRISAPMATDKITADDVRHVAGLARLDVTDEEVELFAGQLAAVLEHAEDVEALDTSAVPPTAHP